MIIFIVAHYNTHYKIIIEIIIDYPLQHLSLTGIFSHISSPSIVDEFFLGTVKIIGRTFLCIFNLILCIKLLVEISFMNFRKVRLGFNFLHLDIPENWSVVLMKSLSTLKKESISTGPFGSLIHSSDYIQDGIPFILGRNIRNGKISDIDIPRISGKDAERLSRYSLKEGDIVFSRVGTVGSAALVESKHCGWIISGLVLLIRFENPQVNPSYINYFIQSDIFMKGSS
jgi:hypothetical protein